MPHECGGIREIVSWGGARQYGSPFCEESMMSSPMEKAESISSQPVPHLAELKELAERWALPLSWLREACRSRCADPLPCVRLGRYVRVDLADPALSEWLNRRRVAGGRK
jgi:hypothetical protein